MSILRGSIVFVIGLLLVILGALEANADNFLTVKQMKLHHGPKGLPFLWHFGMWGDYVLLSPLLGILTAYYSNGWTARAYVVSIIWGLLFSAAMHVFWMRGAKAPEAHIVFRSHQMLNPALSMAGWVHVAYMTGATTIILLAYFWTPGASARVLYGTAGLLAIQFIFGNHIVLGWLHKPWFPQQPQKSIAAWGFALGTPAALLLRTWWIT